MTAVGLDQTGFVAAARTLAARDPRLAAVVEAYGIPSMWRRPQGFPTLVLFILEQQVSLASAAATFRKIRDRIGPVTPEAVAATTPEELRADGVSRQKDRYLRALADALLTGALDLDRLADLDDPAVVRALTALPGIGAWTADVYLLACLGRSDSWPVGDRALQVAAAESLGLDRVPTALELREIGERWRPHRATAARLLWNGYLIRRNRVEIPNSELGLV